MQGAPAVIANCFDGRTLLEEVFDYCFLVFLHRDVQGWLAILVKSIYKIRYLSQKCADTLEVAFLNCCAELADAAWRSNSLHFPFRSAKVFMDVVMCCEECDFSGRLPSFVLSKELRTPQRSAVLEHCLCSIHLPGSDGKM